MATPRYDAKLKTRLRARVPRANCKAYGVKTIAIDRVGKLSRFTLMFKAFAVQVVRACNNVKNAAKLLGLDWDTLVSRMH